MSEALKRGNIVEVGGISLIIPLSCSRYTTILPPDRVTAVSFVVLVSELGIGKRFRGAGFRASQDAHVGCCL